MIDIICPHCSAVYHSDETHIGKQLRCTNCGSPVPILGPAIGSAATRSGATPVPARSGEQTNPFTGRVKGRVAAYSVATVLVLLLATLAFILLRQRPNSPTIESNEVLVRDGMPHSASSKSQTSTSHDADVPTSLAPCDSLPTGTRIEEDIGIRGHGKLTVENGTADDAWVRLFNQETTRSFYVKAHNSARIGKIPAGTYNIAFASGLCWDASQSAFNRNTSYGEFDQQFVYEEKHDSDSIHYQEIGVTLNPVIFGNISTTPITREQFLARGRTVSC
jgi:hypothetical protein